MKKPGKKHIEALTRTVQAKQIALDSRHLPIEIRKEIAGDIELLTDIRLILYRVMDGAVLYL